MNNTNEVLDFGLHSIKPTKIINLPNQIVLGCPTIQAAFRLSFSRALVPRDDEAWANALGLSSGAFNTILRNDLTRKTKEKAGLEFRARYIPDIWFEVIAELTGNNAVGQYMYLLPQRKRLLKQIEEDKLYRQLEFRS